MRGCSRLAMVGSLLGFGLFWFSSSCSHSATADAPVATVAASSAGPLVLTPPAVINGGVVRVELSGHTPDEKLEGEFEGKKFHFAWDSAKKIATGYFGIPHDRKVGAAKVTVTIKTHGKSSVETTALEIKDANYPMEHLKVDPKHVNPPKKEMARIVREIKKVTRVFTLQSAEKFWQGEFALPVPNTTFTSLYGGRRMYNGEERNFHGGLDFKAGVGTPVYATQDGTIELSEDLYFTGNTVMIDHGLGIVTMVAHLSKRQVKAGQKVKRGQLLGLSGATGRVSGPHVHWQIYVQSVKVNPQEFLKVVK